MKCFIVFGAKYSWKVEIRGDISMKSDVDVAMRKLAQITRFCGLQKLNTLNL